MKRLFLSLSMVILCVLTAFSQTPYDNFAPEQGVKSMIELSEMQFKVVNTDQNSEIRSVEFNKNTHSVRLLNDDGRVLKTVVLNPDDKKFTTMDPLAEKYYSISPYVYCANNPLNSIDPTGMDYYILTDDGRTVLAKKTDDKTDKLFAVKKTKEGNKYADIANTLTVNKGLLSGLSKNGIGETSNNSDAFNVYSFAVNNSNVEWSLAGYKEGNQTNYVLNTSYEKDGVSYNRNGNDENSLLFHVHSHPGNSKGSKQASGYDLYSAGISMGGSDAEFMKNRFNSAKNANKKWPSEYPKLFFFHKNTNTLYHYNHKTDSQIVGKVATPAIMNTLISKFRMRP